MLCKVIKVNFYFFYIIIKNKVNYNLSYSNYILVYN